MFSFSNTFKEFIFYILNIKVWRKPDYRLSNGGNIDKNYVNYLLNHYIME